MKTRLPSDRGAWAAIVVRLVDDYRRLVEPRLDGLPTRQVLLALPALLLLFGVIVVALGINGTSSGAMHDRVYAGKDPALIEGQPELIRSDEWYVNTSWSIAQVQQGLPARNHTMPGGMDASLPHDLPRADWAVVFRPQLWGYLFFDVGHATAFKWWIAALTSIAATYCFLVTLLPRRPLAAAAISIGFYFSPFFQWWFQTVIFWPMAWALVTVTALIWATKDKSWRTRWAWAAVVGFLTVVMAMGIYAPFIVPVVLVVALFAVGLMIERRRLGSRWLDILAHGAPVLSAGVVGVAITARWLATSKPTLDAFLATSYPGQRLIPAGSSSALVGARTISSSFSESLKLGNGFLGTNSSEASTFFLIGAFMIPIVGWVLYRSVRQRVVLPWPLLGLVASVLLFVAFSYVRGWDRIAHLLFLDRTSDGRLRIGLGLASIAILAYLVKYLDERSARVGRVFSSATAATFLVSQAAVAVAVVIVEGHGRLWHDAPFWWLFALLGAAAIYCFARRQVAAGALAFLLIGVIGTATVNPIYVGVFDLRTTPTAKAVMRVDAAHPGVWVGVGGVEVTGILLESGVTAFNGTQGAPSPAMWKAIDPTGKYRFNWNRLAGIGWIPQAGEPTVSNPAPDQIMVTIDACSVFAQKHVDYVLSGNPDLKSTCLDRVAAFPIPQSTLTIFRVVK